jgi:hypothetical protein
VHTATVSHSQTSQQVSPTSSDLNSLFETGDAALEAFQGDATARLVVRPIAPTQKTSGAGTSPTAAYEAPPSSTAAQWQNYAYNGEKDVQMALQLQQEKEHRAAAEERANQAIELARQLAMTLAAQQGLDANGIMPGQQNPPIVPQQNNNMVPSPTSTAGILPQQSPGLLPMAQQATLPPLNMNQGPAHNPLRPSYSYNDFTSQGAAAAAAQYNLPQPGAGQNATMDSATAAAARCAHAGSPCLPARASPPPTSSCTLHHDSLNTIPHHRPNNHSPTTRQPILHCTFPRPPDTQ